MTVSKSLAVLVFGGCVRGAVISSAVISSGALMFSALMGCSAAPLGASDANLAQARSRAGHGGALFSNECASCHGPRGEGLAGAPSVIGVTALPRYPRDSSGVQRYQDPALMQRQAQLRVPGAASRPEFVTALDLHNYLKTHLGVFKPESAAALTGEDYFALVSFILIAHGSTVPEQLSADNASTVPIRAD